MWSSSSSRDIKTIFFFLSMWALNVYIHNNWSQNHSTRRLYVRLPPRDWKHLNPAKSEIVLVYLQFIDLRTQNVMEAFFSETLIISMKAVNGFSFFLSPTSSSFFHLTRFETRQDIQACLCACVLPPLFKRCKMKSDKLMEYVTRFRENHIIFELEFIAFSEHVQACVLKLLKNLFSWNHLRKDDDEIGENERRTTTTLEKADFPSHFISFCLFRICPGCIFDLMNTFSSVYEFLRGAMCI